MDSKQLYRLCCSRFKERWTFLAVGTEFISTWLHCIDRRCTVEFIENDEDALQRYIRSASPFILRHRPPHWRMAHAAAESMQRPEPLLHVAELCRRETRRKSCSISPGSCTPLQSKQCNMHSPTARAHASTNRRHRRLA